MGPRGVAISFMECKHRYGVDYHTVATWVARGEIVRAGTVMREGKNGPRPALELVWSNDVEDAVRRHGLYHKLSDYTRWASLVKREYEKRKLGNPPPEALGLPGIGFSMCLCHKPCCAGHARVGEGEMGQ